MTDFNPRASRPRRVSPILKLTLAGLFLIAAALDLRAVDTRFWQQNDQNDFEKGSLDNVSLRSDGRLSLAPASREVLDSGTPYLWALACDSKGNLYTGGGGETSGRAKLFEIARDGKTKTLAELDALEIHAIAIDKQDRIYAATAPDGKVYRIGRDGKSQVFYDPHAKYIWAIIFDAAGNLFVATGDQGEVHRVTPDGHGSVFFRTEETHARSLALDHNGNLIVGTEPGGLVLRISPSGAGFVLYQAPKREITSVAVAADGVIYAAAVGVRSNTPVSPPSPAASPSVSATSAAPRPVGSPSSNPLPPQTVGGSNVYRIDTDGAPLKVWSNSQDIVYAIAFDAGGHPLLGTGNKGRIYRLDSPVVSTQLLTVAPTQATNFATTPQHELYVITGNIGKVYEIGPGFAPRGTFESEAFDAGSFAYWGRLSLRGSNAGLSMRTRSGNVNRPVNNWSPWASLALQDKDGDKVGRITSPPARFIQYEVTLAPATGGAPHVSSVDVAYLTKNVAPVVQQIEITPPNYKFPSSSLSSPSTSISLPPLGQRRSSSSGASSDGAGSSQTMNYAKGYIGARWLAHDENGDSMEYKIEIRGRGETNWKLVKDHVTEKMYAWDSAAFPDGEYELRVTASDAPSNPPNEALSASLDGDPFLIDNTPPEISGLTATARGANIEVAWRAKDARSIIDHAEYSLDGSEWKLVEPLTKLSDSEEEEYRLAIPAGSAGEHTIAVRVVDYYDNQSVAKAVVK